MDYKFRQGMILIASLCILTVLGIVLMANWKSISRRVNKTNKPVTESSVSVSDTVEETINSSTGTFFKGNQVGNDLSAWKSDPSFFVNDFEDTSLLPGDKASEDISGNDVSENDGIVNTGKETEDRAVGEDPEAIEKENVQDLEDGLSKRDNSEN